MKQKILAVLLTVCLVISLTTVSVFATDTVAPEQLSNAVAAAEDNTTIALGDGTYSFPSMKNRTLSFTGTKNTIFEIPAVQYQTIGDYSNKLTFTGITFKYGNVNYTGLCQDTIEYNDCTFEGQPFLYGNKVTFNGCTFNQNSSNAYNVWTYGAKEVTFNNCVFNSEGKSVLIYTENGTIMQTVNFNECKFIAGTAVEGKAAIEMDSSLLKTGKFTLNVKCSTQQGFANGSVSGDPLFNPKKGDKFEYNSFHGENISHTDAVAAIPCKQDGTQEYWYCADCERYYSDSALTAETTLEALTVSKGVHKFSAVDKVDASYEANGIRAHYKCEYCGELRLTEAGEAVQLEDLVIPKLIPEQTEDKKPEATGDEKKEVVANPATDDAETLIPWIAVMVMAFVFLLPVTLKKAKLNK